MKITDLQGSFPLANGVNMPYFGLGVWQSKEGEEVVNAVQQALKIGYRHIDTAAVYKNERGVGQAIANSDVAREEVFVTSKVWNADQGYANTLKAFDASLERLGMEYLDLYLVHWAVKGKYKDTWRALEDLYQQGKVRAIGVSNFMQHHLEDLMEGATVMPMVNQMEFHPYLQQPNLVHFCQQQGIQYEAWSPIMRGKVLDVELLVELGKKYGKSAVQVALRWELQRGIVTIPKSVTPARIEANAQIFDFALTNEEMLAIDALDCQERMGPDPDNFNF